MLCKLQRSQIAGSCWLWVILLKCRNPNFNALTMTYRLCYNSFRCCTTANFHLLQIPSLSHSRQALLPCAVVYLMNLRISPKPVIKATLKLKLDRAYAPC